MSRQSMQQYAERARVIPDPLLASARLELTRPSERMILRADVIEKLEITQYDRVLDIGSGIGNLSIPLSFMVAEYTCVDHPDVLARMKRRLPEETIEYIPGNFLDVTMTKTFTKILIYDCIHYLSDVAELELFLTKAVNVLEVGGLMLIGDIPSPGYKDRYFKSALGIEHGKRWDTASRGTGQKELDAKALLSEPKDERTMLFSDGTLLSIVGSLRQAGLQAWLLPQAWGLPFSNQREDILVKRL